LSKIHSPEKTFHKPAVVEILQDKLLIPADADSTADLGFR